MTEISLTPDLMALEIPVDLWTQSFWDATEQGQLRLPRCADCERFRWPPGPFCPHCQSQRVEWLPAGPARIYSFTLVSEPRPVKGDLPRYRVPALVEFPEAGSVRMLAAIVQTPLEAIHIGAQLTLDWLRAANATVPVFKISPSLSD